MPTPYSFNHKFYSGAGGEHRQVLDSAYADCRRTVDVLLSAFLPVEGVPRYGGSPGIFEAVDAACKKFHDTILRVCPASEDRDVALQHVRRAHMNAIRFLEVRCWTRDPAPPASWYADVRRWYEHIEPEIYNAYLFAFSTTVHALPEELDPTVRAN